MVRSRSLTTRAAANRSTASLTGSQPESGPQRENLITSDWKVRSTLPARGSS